MKVAFIVRDTFTETFGGDTVQTLATAEFLRKIGIDVDIHPTHHKVPYHSYDILHFFNIIRPDDILPHIRKTQKPFVVSSIFVDYSYYASKGNHRMYPILYRLFNADQMEYIKRLARSVFNKEYLPSMSYLLMGHRRSIRLILKRTAMLLPNSVSEYKRLVKHYPEAGKFHVVPNGIDTNKFNPDLSISRDLKKVISVGRIEVRKNQLNLIRALNNTEFQLHIIGKSAPNHFNYFEQCKSEAASNIHFHNHVDDQELMRHYSTSMVHVLPSRFETTGLSTLEAIGMGCVPVITDCGDTFEYFGNDVTYCDPENLESILDAVKQAIKKGPDQHLINRIRLSYNWQRAAEETLNAYREVLA